MSVLGRKRLEDLLCHAEISKRLIITPLLNKAQQVGDASIDIGWATTLSLRVEAT